MITKLRLLIVSLVIVVLSTLTMSQAHADVNDFVINSFDADYTLTANQNKQAEMHVVEKIDLTFSDNNHGILRAIPKTYKNQTLKIHINSVSSPTGAPSSYTSKNQNNNMVLKIGSSSSTVTGHQQYVVDYTIQNVVTFYNDHDELYWDINGDQWQQSFTAVTAQIHVPALSMNGQLRCFTGTLNETMQDCTITKLTDDLVAASTSDTLQRAETLTVVVGFQKGYFVAAKEPNVWLRIISIVGASLILPIFVGFWAFQSWRKFGKDIKPRGTIIAEYAPPANLTPAEVGIIYDYKLDTKDISATIIDLAIKKYLVIVEEREKKFLKNQTVYLFKRLQSDTSNLKPHELAVLNAIFSDLPVGSEVKLDSLKNKFYTTVKSLKKSIPASLTAKGYFDNDPTKAGNRLYIAGAILLFLGFLTLFIIIGFSLILAAIVLFIFGSLMDKLSQKGVDTKEAIEGLKLYMNTAEKDRLAMLQSVDSPYAKKSGEPKQTVDLFEKLLPFAIVLGVESSWAKQFESIYTVPPDWYSGNWQTFNSVYLTSSLTNSIGAMATNFSPPSSSSSSGFGGGGFSGGGGGGGGGGGW